MENTIYNNVDEDGNPLENGVHYVLYNPENGVATAGPIVEHVDGDFYLIEGCSYENELYYYDHEECVAIRQK
jgi:hypothetical protein